MVSGFKSALGVQSKWPEFSIESARVSMGWTLLEGPRRSTREMGPLVVGSHSMVYGLPAVTRSWRPGLVMALPEGGLL